MFYDCRERISFDRIYTERGRSAQDRYAFPTIPLLSVSVNLSAESHGVVIHMQALSHGIARESERRVAIPPACHCEE